MTNTGINTNFKYTTKLASAFPVDDLLILYSVISECVF